ncbi:hypothetical protein HDU87_004223 [Geranomyces variabilis]|uniref:WD40 repeat-like protein n=1 Tax=Geranomyces variabilis TaxID=109894 RepID=A0AAD5TK39_9FUNG|nr:hypothetical protein HDU87_004223 [Geranomyces variabilis]
MPQVLLAPHLPLLVDSSFSDPVVLSGLQHAVPWRLNLTACSIKDPTLFFVAVNSRTLVFRTPHPSAADVGPLKPSSEIPSTIHLGEVGDETINSIRLGTAGDEEVLAVCRDDGSIQVWFVADLQRRPLQFQHKESAWGLALHGPRFLLAASANSHTIIIWNLKREEEGTSEEDGPSRQKEERFVEFDQLELEGHEHNVPSIDFSTCGKFLASASIDCCVRIWNVDSGACIFRKFSNQWCGASLTRSDDFQVDWSSSPIKLFFIRLWAVRFIDPFDFKRVPAGKTPNWANVFKTKPDDVRRELSKRFERGVRKGTLPEWTSSTNVPQPDDAASEFDEAASENETYHQAEDPPQMLSDADDVTLSEVVSDTVDMDCEVDTASTTGNHADVTSALVPDRTSALNADEHTIASDEEGSDSSSHWPHSSAPLDLSDSEDSDAMSVDDGDEVLQYVYDSHAFASDEDGGLFSDMEYEMEDDHDDEMPTMYRSVSWWRQRPYEPPPPAPILGRDSMGVNAPAAPIDILLATSMESLYLLDSRTLTTCHEQLRLVSRYDMRAEVAPDRLALVAVMPELGAAVVASQKGTAAIVRFVRNRDEAGTTRYMTIVEGFLPTAREPPYPLLGLFAVRHADEGSSSTYHVHMLYADGHMFGYSVRSSFNVNPLRGDRLQL